MSEKRKLLVQKLAPPVEITKRILTIDNSKLPKNPILRFLKLFFGEGF